jgi:SHS2 domain-containing protein
MPWELLDHQADVGLQATGETLEIALADGGRGMPSLMIETSLVEPDNASDLQASGSDPGALFVDVLNAVLATKDIHTTFFCDVEINSLEERENGWHASCRLFGEPIDLSRNIVDSDVKATNYRGLRVQHDERGWLLRCLLDL